MKDKHTPTDLAVFKELASHPDLTAIKLSDIILVADTTLQIYKRIITEEKNVQTASVDY